MPSDDPTKLLSREWKESCPPAKSPDPSFVHATAIVKPSETVAEICISYATADTPVVTIGPSTDAASNTTLSALVGGACPPGPPEDVLQHAEFSQSLEGFVGHVPKLRTKYSAVAARAAV